MAIFIITVVQATYRIWRSKCGRSVDEGIDNEVIAVYKDTYYIDSCELQNFPS
jgi:hypothetical protein